MRATAVIDVLQYMELVEDDPRIRVGHLRANDARYGSHMSIAMATMPSRTVRRSTNLHPGFVHAKFDPIDHRHAITQRCGRTRAGANHRRRGSVRWFIEHDPVTRIGTDEGGRSARLCDLAVWTALRLGIKLPASGDKLANYDDATIAATRAALLQLATP